MSAGTRNSTHTLVGGPRRDRYSDVSPRPPVLGLPIVPTAHRASSTLGDSRCLEAPPQVHLSRLHRLGPTRTHRTMPARSPASTSVSRRLAELRAVRAGRASRSWSDANSTGRRPPGQSSGWDCELPATHSWRDSSHPVASGYGSHRAYRTASPAQLHTLADGWPLVPLAQPESLRAKFTCPGLRSWPPRSSRSRHGVAFPGDLSE
jgi:hypothetical protein